MFRTTLTKNGHILHVLGNLLDFFVERGIETTGAAQIRTIKRINSL
jgi:hypothetical protein